MREDKENVNSGGVVAQTASLSQTSKYACGKDGSAGHGFTAEDANALADIFKGKSVHKIGTSNIKNGADRISNGISIQTKYCKTAHDTVKAAFEDGVYRYKLRNGRPMKLEVPSDQYEEVIEIMRKKILEGKVIGVKNPEHASKMIQKGVVSYLQALKLAKAGTIESLVYDVASGAISSTSSAGISAVIEFLIQKKEGKSTKEALKSAGIRSAQAAALTMTQQVVTNQLEKAIVQTAAKKASQKAVESVVKESGKSVTKSVMTSVAKSSMRTNAITAAVTTVVTTLPDINKARKGDITWGECGKRATVNTGSVVAGIVATALVAPLVANPAGAIAISLVAGMGGSFVGGKLTEKVTEKGMSVVSKTVSFFKKKKK